jgi:predicted aspartyl protease
VPILHAQLSAQGTQPDGSKFHIPPNIVMQERGPCVQVTVGVAQTIAEQLLQQGQPVPQPVSGMGLIDTGASTTCIDDAIARQLQLPVIDVVQMSSASHASTQQNVYPVKIELVGSGIDINVPQAIGAALSAQGIVALIGRDFLQHCTLFYNGITGQITLSL